MNHQKTTLPKGIDATIIRWEDLDQKDGFYLTPTVQGISAKTPGYYGIFFTARRPAEVLWVAIRYDVTAGAAATLDIYSVPDGTALASGNSIFASTFNLNTTADTLQIKQTTDFTSYAVLPENQSLGLVIGGTPTNLEQLSITIYSKFSQKGHYR